MASFDMKVEIPKATQRFMESVLQMIDEGCAHCEKCQHWHHLAKKIKKIDIQKVGV